MLQQTGDPVTKTQLAMNRILSVVSLLAVAFVCQGCQRQVETTAAGDSTNTPSGSATSTPGQASPAATESPASTLAPCTLPTVTVTLPADFPESFQMPPETVIFASQRVNQRIVLDGFVPMDFPEASRFFLQKLLASGYRLGESEVEMGEAEGRFAGHGVTGFFKVRAIGCKDGCRLTVGVQKR